MKNATRLFALTATLLTTSCSQQNIKTKFDLNDSLTSELTRIDALITSTSIEKLSASDATLFDQSVRDYQFAKTVLEGTAAASQSEKIKALKKLQFASDQLNALNLVASTEDELDLALSESDLLRVEDVAQQAAAAPARPVSTSIDSLVEDLQSTFKKNQLKLEKSASGELAVSFPSIKFQTAKTELSSDAENTLLKLSQVLKKYPQSQIKLIGMADSRGKQSLNESLSLNRAEQVSRFLVGQQSTTPSNLTLESKIATSEATPTERANNRTVLFSIRP